MPSNGPSTTGTGIIVMHTDDLDHLAGTREAVEGSIEPVLVTLGGSGAGSGGCATRSNEPSGST